MIRHLILLLSFFVVTIVNAAPGCAAGDEQFETKFWQFLIGNNYKQWAPGPSQDGGFFSGQVPHGALLKLYINRSAASDVEGLQIGSVVVLENYRSDKSLKSISVMYRTEGFNPNANDWYWIEYNPDGSVVKDDSNEAGGDSSFGSLLEAQVSTNQKGRSASCIACHNEAGGSDFAFFNDSNDANVAGSKERETLSLR